MRNIKIDLSRGLLMIYIIVIIHGIFILNLIQRPYSTFFLVEMPLIFLVSGYTFGITSKNISGISLSHYWIYFRARLSRILLPYLAYAIFCSSLIIFMGKSKNNIQAILSWVNPLTYGNGYSFSTLNWHLWFIPPFIIITLLLPICKQRIVAKTPTLYSIIFLIISFLTLSYLKSDLSTYVFYFIWAFLGFKLTEDLKFSRKQILLISSFILLLLLIAKYYLNISLDMQSNKFPPNYIFLVFSIFSSSIIVYASSKVSSETIHSIAKNKFISLFISYGYSLYLWQGLGYAVAIHLQNKYSINTLITWLVAIATTVIFGILASPIEKIRWRQSS